MRNRKRIIAIFSLIIGLGLVYTGFLQVKISQYSHATPANNADYLIVLGAKVNGTVPSLSLASRIDAAGEYLKEHPDTIAIASGGQGRGEDISEAECIRRELVKQGINAERIILEDKSTDTYENIRFSKKLLPADAIDGVVVTNTFHLYRAVSIASDQELEIQGLPAETPVQAVVKSYLREYLALTKFYLKRYLFD